MNYMILGVFCIVALLLCTTPQQNAVRESPIISTSNILVTFTIGKISKQIGNFWWSWVFQISWNNKKHNLDNHQIRIHRCALLAFILQNTFAFSSNHEKYVIAYCKLTIVLALLTYLVANRTEYRFLISHCFLLSNTKKKQIYENKASWNNWSWKLLLKNQRHINKTRNP